MKSSTGRHERPLCGSNLEARGQNLRLRMGIVMLAASLVGAVALVEADIPRLWRLTLFAPFFLAAFGAWQGLYRTCPGLVMKGCREVDGEAAKVSSPDETRGARRLARRVVFGAVTTASVATALVVAIP